MLFRSAAAQKPAADPNALKTDAQGGYVRKWATDITNAKSRDEKVALAKEMINFLKDRQGTPEGKMMAKAAEMVIKRLGDPTLSKVIGGLKKLQMERANYVIAAYILNEVGLTWKDLGMKVVLSESTVEHITIAYR